MRSQETKSATVVERESGLRRSFGLMIKSIGVFFGGLELLELLVVLILITGACFALVWKGFAWILSIVGLG